MPGINDAPEQVEAILEAAAEAGATGIGGIALHLRGEVRGVFLDWLRAYRPDLVPALRGALPPRRLRASGGAQAAQPPAQGQRAHAADALLAGPGVAGAGPWWLAPAGRAGENAEPTSFAGPGEGRHGRARGPEATGGDADVAVLGGRLRGGLTTDGMDLRHRCKPLGTAPHRPRTASDCRATVARAARLRAGICPRRRIAFVANAGLASHRRARRRHGHCDRSTRHHDR